MWIVCSIFKIFGLVREHSLYFRNISVSSYSVFQTVLIHLIQFSISSGFVYTELNVENSPILNNSI